MEVMTKIKIYKRLTLRNTYYEGKRKNGHQEREICINIISHICIDILRYINQICIVISDFFRKFASSKREVIDRFT